jgi:DNA-binding transcriptional regulator YdaS (Cro superfamily)
MTSKDPGLQAAIDAVGGLRALARLLGISASAIAQWRRVPAHRIVEIELGTGVPREILRPDLYRRIGPGSSTASLHTLPSRSRYSTQLPSSAASTCSPLTKLGR